MGSAEPLAPLASMEDLSVLATPMSTPGPSPRTRARWSHQRNGVPTEQSNGNGGLSSQEWPVTSTPKKIVDGARCPEWQESAVPQGNCRDKSLEPPHRRFASPARRTNLLKQSLINQAYQPPKQNVPLMLNDEVIAGSYPHPSPVRRYRRSRPPPGYSRSCDPIQEEEMSLGQEGPSRAWHSASDDATDRQALLRQPQVQFLTPRRSDSPSLASEVSHHWGYRVAAAEEELMGLEEPQPPVDRFNLIYFTFILHGVGTLIPWNMFINAKELKRGDWFNMLTEYFVDYKLVSNYTKEDAIPYATYFLQYIGFAAQVPNVIFNWINIFLNVSGTLTSRVVWTLFIEVVIFVVTIVLAMIDSSTWPGIFFYLTIFSVVILNMVNGIYQNTVYGLAAKLPFKYTGAVVLGSNLSGTIIAVINLISIAMAPNPRTAAIYYFITALFILLACFDTYFALPLNRFFRYHDHMYNSALLEKKKRSVVHAIPYWSVFKRCFPQCFNVFFTFFVTLAIFPAVHAEIRCIHPEFPIASKYFSAITCFLTFNLCAVIGNLLPGILKWPSPRWLFIPVLLRFLFVPFFALCNYRPAGLERLWPVLIHSDWVYWAGGALLGLSSGYLSSMAMMFCPRTVEPEYASTAGMFGAASIVTGIFAGIGFSYLLPIAVSHPELNFEPPDWWPQYEGSYL